MKTHASYYARVRHMAREMTDEQQFALIDDLLDGHGVTSEQIAEAIEQERSKAQSRPAVLLSWDDLLGVAVVLLAVLYGFWQWGRAFGQSESEYRAAPAVSTELKEVNR